jgi:hypothetical protein
VGLVDGAEGPAVFVFSVRRSQLDGEPTGRLEYRGSRRGAIVRGVALTSFQVVGETASFGGTCVQDTAGGSEAPCIYKATAVDGDRPGPGQRGDRFTIEVSGAGPEGGALRSGAVEVFAGPEGRPPRP